MTDSLKHLFGIRGHEEGDTELTIKKIADEYKNAENFEPSPSQFLLYIAERLGVVLEPLCEKHPIRHPTHPPAEIQIFGESSTELHVVDPKQMYISLIKFYNKILNRDEAESQRTKIPVPSDILNNMPPILYYLGNPVAIINTSYARTNHQLPISAELLILMPQEDESSLQIVRIRSDLASQNSSKRKGFLSIGKVWLAGVSYELDPPVTLSPPLPSSSPHQNP